MKKSVIALAAMAVVGGASAQVTISGIMDGYIGSGNQFGQKISLVGQSGARTTTFKFNGSEDLGGGTKANFQFEIQPQFVAADGNGYNTTVWGAGLGANGASQTAITNQISSGMAGKGQSYLGIVASDFDIRIGTNNTHGVDTQVNGAGGANGFGTGVGSGYGAGYGSTSQNTFTRFEESISIRSPIMNGAQVRYLTNLKNDKSYGSTTGGYTIRRPAVSEWGAEYKNGPLQLDAALLSVKNSDNEATTVTTTSTSTNYTALSSGVTTKYTSYSASYDLGVARLGFISQKVKNDATTYSNYAGVPAIGTDPHTEAKWQMVTANIPVGAFRVLVGSGKYSLVNNPATLLNGQKNTLTSFALEYDLSKRTYAYLRFQQGSNGATNAATTLVNGVTTTNLTSSGLTAAQLATQTFNLGGIGISHAF